MAKLVLSFLLIGAIFGCSIAESKFAYLGKKYTLTSSDKFEEFMKAIGVGWFTRNGALLVKPTVSVTEDNGLYIMKTESTFKSQELKFKLGEEFDEVTLDGRDVKSVITLEGDNKLVHIQKGDKPVTIIREFGPTEMKAVMTYDTVTSTRIYKLDE